MTQAYDVRGVTFNGHHSAEFGLAETTGDQIGMPAKTKYTVTIAGSNTPIDLSNMYGAVYGERTYTKTFICNQDMWGGENQYRLWTKVINWVMAPRGKIPLYDDVMPNWHYLAEVEAQPTFTEGDHQATITITWQCYPFRIKNSPEFDDVWDTFDFDFDVCQNTTVSANYTSTVLYNQGPADIDLTAVTDRDCTVTIGDTTYTLLSGTNSGMDMTLAPGENQVALNDASATVKFSWYQEMI